MTYGFASLTPCTEAVADLERYFEMLRAYYNIPKDQPVFPPKPKIDSKPKGDLKPRRAA